MEIPPAPREIPVPDRFSSPFAATGSRTAPNDSPTKQQTAFEPPTAKPEKTQQPEEEGEAPSEDLRDLAEDVGEAFKVWAGDVENFIKEYVLPGCKTIKDTGQAGVIHVGGKTIEVAVDVASFILTDPYIILGGVLFTIGGGVWDKSGEVMDRLTNAASNTVWGKFGYAPENLVTTIDTWQRLVGLAHYYIAGGMAGAVMSSVMRPWVNIQKHVAEGARARYHIPGAKQLADAAEAAEEINMGGGISEEMVKYMIKAIKDTAVGAERRSDRSLAIGNDTYKRPNVTYAHRGNGPPVPIHTIALDDAVRIPAARAKAATKKAAMEDPRIHAQAKATSDRRPAIVKKTGRGLTHVPRPVMPYNDISNDHFFLPTNNISNAATSLR